MKQNSIKQTLPRMAKIMVMVLIVLLLPVNVIIQLYFQHRNQKESSYEVFGPLKQLIEMNERDLMQAREEFSEQCIRSAEMAAYFVEHYPMVTSDLALTRELAEKLDVDDLMQAREEFSEQCIRSAEMAAYFVEHYPMVTSDLALTRELAEKLDVDGGWNGNCADRYGTQKTVKRNGRTEHGENADVSSDGHEGISAYCR